MTQNEKLRAEILTIRESIAAISARLDGKAEQMLDDAADILELAANEVGEFEPDFDLITKDATI